MQHRQIWLGLIVGISLITGVMGGTADSAPIGYQAVPRDAFPVFDNPDMLSASVAEADGVIYPSDPVIGVALGGEAKAYPITVMGTHELGNDTLGGIPIAVSW